MKILGIETSCDETAASVLEVERGKVKILSNIISSQIKIHQKYGGVVPEVAARKHAEIIFDVIGKALSEAEKSSSHQSSLSKGGGMSDIDLIAVTKGPGLAVALRIGILAGQSLAVLTNKPLVGVNHIEAHLLSPFLENKNIKLSVLGLIVSGGHTELVLMKDFGKYKIIGETRDDAVGEAFDKVAKMLGLGYPGGPAISRQAEKWKSEIRNTKSETNNKFKIQNLKLLDSASLCLRNNLFNFPRPMINSNDFDFSFSGLKTAVLYAVKKMSKAELKKMTPAICAEFQNAAVEVLLTKTARAAEHYNVKSILVGGGVSANKALREELQKLPAPIFISPLEYTGDNAAMIAFAGYKKWQRSKKDEKFKVKANPNLRI